jgi:hypothetical protein
MELSPEDRALIDGLAAKVVRMGMVVPAILFLESSKPLSFLGSQAMVFFEPFVKTFFTADGYTRLSRLMEDRGNVEVLIRRIEALEAEAQEVRRQEKRARKEQKEKEKREKRKGRS